MADALDAPPTRAGTTKAAAAPKTIANGLAITPIDISSSAFAPQSGANAV